MIQICPLISNGADLARCHPSCALNIDGTCALRFLAESKMQELSTWEEEEEDVEIL